MQCQTQGKRGPQTDSRAVPVQKMLRITKTRVFKGSGTPREPEMPNARASSADKVDEPPAGRRANARQGCLWQPAVLKTAKVDPRSERPWGLS